MSTLDNFNFIYIHSQSNSIKGEVVSSINSAVVSTFPTTFRLVNPMSFSVPFPVVLRELRPGECEIGSRLILGTVSFLGRR